MSHHSSRNGTPHKVHSSQRHPTTIAARVQVFVRVRDCTSEESPSDVCIDSPHSSQVEVAVPGRGRFPFAFDGCLWSHRRAAGPDVTSRLSPQPSQSFYDQSLVYDTIGKPVLENAINGYNACILTYGATGSGKTFSMFGPGNSLGTKDMGIVPRMCDDMFLFVASLPRHAHPQLAVSMVEVYMEEVFDLLNHRKELKVRSEGNSFVVVGAKQPSVSSYAEVTELLVQAEKYKTFAATAVHERSSRAHTLFQLELSFVRPDGQLQSSRIVLADLAGCERIKEAKTDSGLAKDQACNINLSLLSLGSCIEAVVRCGAHASSQSASSSTMSIGEFRNSTLTKLLKDFIGGNSVTTMLVTVSPTLADSSNTIQALRFADRAKRLQTTAFVNRSNNSAAKRSTTSSGANSANCSLGGEFDGDCTKSNSMIAQSRERHRELNKRRDLLVQECEAEAALQHSHEYVMQIESMYAKCDERDLHATFHALEQAAAARDACEMELDRVRREAYPREYALRDELETMRANLDAFRDQKELESAVAQVRIHELETALRQRTDQRRDDAMTRDVVEQLRAKVNERENEVRHLQHRCSRHDDDISALRAEMQGRVEALEAEKSQLSMHYQLTIDALTLERDQLLTQTTKATKAHQEELRRHITSTASTRSMLEMERIKNSACLHKVTAAVENAMETSLSTASDSCFALYNEKCSWWSASVAATVLQQSHIDRRVMMDAMNSAMREQQASFRSEMETVLQQCFFAQNAILSATQMAQQATTKYFRTPSVAEGPHNLSYLACTSPHCHNRVAALMGSPIPPPPPTPDRKSQLRAPLTSCPSNEHHDPCSSSSPILHKTPQRRHSSLPTHQGGVNENSGLHEGGEPDQCTPLEASRSPPRLSAQFLDTLEFTS